MMAGRTRDELLTMRVEQDATEAVLAMAGRKVRGDAQTAQTLALYADDIARAVLNTLRRHYTIKDKVRRAKKGGRRAPAKPV